MFYGNAIFYYLTQIREGQKEIILKYLTDQGFLLEKLKDIPPDETDYLYASVSFEFQRQEDLCNAILEANRYFWKVLNMEFHCDDKTTQRMENLFKKPENQMKIRGLLPPNSDFSLTWSHGKPLIRVYTQASSFEGLPDNVRLGRRNVPLQYKSAA